MTCRTLGLAMAAAALVALAGCNRIGNPLEVLVAKPPAPDEFQVMPREPLRMPASLSLPEPRPGTPSPLEPDPGRDAVMALLGADPRAGGAAGTSAGEQALLAAANTASADPAIRRRLETDAAAGGDGPYEAPYVWELFGLGGDAPPQDAIDPAAEARRLQAEGVAAPVDPAARPELAAEAVEEEPSPYPALGTDRPQNKLPSSGPVPAF